MNLQAPHDQSELTQLRQRVKDLEMQLDKQHANSALRKQDEDALRKSEERFRSLLSSIPSVAVQGYGPDGTTQYWNQASERLYGFSAQEAIGRNLLDLIIPPEMRADVTQAIQQMAETGHPIPASELSLMRQDGSRVAVFSSHAIVQIPGRAPELFCMDIDLTERKQAEMKIRESEERYRLLYESSLDAILLTAPDGRIFSVNSSACRMFERAEDEFKQIGRSGIVDTSDPRLALALEERKRTGNFNGELTFIRKSGARFPGEISSSVFKDKEGTLGTSMIIRDITDRKQAEAEKAELETQNRQLQKAKSLGRMAGAIAHHFNNQLQVVMGNLEMAMHDLPRGAQTLEPLAEALKAAHKAAEVSSLMLTYRGQTPGKQAPLDLSEVCRQSLPLLQAAAPKNMILNADFPSPGPVIRADTGHMQQVLTRLVTNAWEAADEKQGCINLTVKTVSLMHIPASKRFPIDWQPRESDYACLEVADTGCGIPDSCIEKIFDPFFTTKFTGRGLGLPVVLGLVGSHGGGITVESKPGQGSVFRVFLPVSAVAIPIPPEKAVKALETEGGGTVLVVEDEVQVRNMLKIMLTRLGFTVLEARDGVEAVEVFRQHRDKICCVICDLTMPRMDGWETLAALRSLSPGIPVVLSSGYDEERVMAGDHAELPQAFLGKPYQLKDLHETIQKAIGETTADR